MVYRLGMEPMKLYYLNVTRHVVPAASESEYSNSVIYSNSFLRKLAFDDSFLYLSC